MAGKTGGAMRPDVVIIGSGVGGAAIALSLAATGARILVLERGPRLPVEPENADAEAVFVRQRYRAREDWQDGRGRRFRPGQYYFVGGHTKFYGTAMFRLRRRDFEAVEHEEGVSPAWPISYADLEPYYVEAERLFGVHGAAGADPTEPPRSAAFPHPPVPHEPVIGRIAEKLTARGLQPFHMPAAIDLRPGGACRRCGTCDAFPCRFGAKGDAETRLLAPALAHPNVTLWSEARVTRLIADHRNAHIVAAEIERGGETLTVRAPLFVLSAGALNSALLLLRSADGHNPHGLANGSGVVGRHFMNHHLTGLMGLMPFAANDTRYAKTLSLNDFYFGAADDPVPLGNIQMLGNIQEPMIRSAYPRLPRMIGRWTARHSVDFLAMSEDLPHWDSTIRPLPGDRAELVWQPTNRAPHRRLVARTKKLLHAIGFPVVLTHGFGAESPSHQCGTVRMGTDPATSALDPLCRAHDHPNLYVVDAGFFPSSAAVNPALTVAAQALRVGRHLRARWFGASASAPAALPFA